MIIITGLGRTGTSFVAEMFKNLGYDVGGGWSNILQAGYEHVGVTALNKKMLSGEWWGTEVELAELRTISEGCVVAKDPRFMFTLGKWIRAGVSVDGIVLCRRNIRETVASSRSTGAGVMSILDGIPWNLRLGIAERLIGAVVAICDEENIKLIVIDYPDSLVDFNQIQQLQKLVKVDRDKLYKAWQSTIRVKSESARRPTTALDPKTKEYIGVEL